MSNRSQEELDISNIFKILIATDIHLGYGEGNPIRENDSFNTFEEILQIAVKENVDFILLGGDLFHETRPTSYCIYKCTELIRKYCLGDKPVEIEFLSDPSFNFQSHNPFVNYEDPNMNISIPIFSIHGNHDDPTGKRQISAMDLMASMGLINYFGRWNDLSHVDVVPILLKKGESQLALYGLSHIRDERLARLFLDQKVIMKTPDNVDEWFNLLVLHQNRANRGAKNFIAESFIPEFVDLVMWGHEHDCRIEPTRIIDSDGFITQPGSSVATSLSEGEAITKHVGLLYVNRNQFNITPIALHTVRPFVFKTIVMELKQSDLAKKKIKNIIEEMLEEAQQLGRQNDLLPLLRLFVKYQDERQVFNAIQFGTEYVGRVANPEDMIKFVSFVKKGRRLKTSILNNDGSDEEVEETVVERVEELIPKHLGDQTKLMILSLSGFNEAISKFITANDSEAPAYLINYQAKKTLEMLIEMHPDENEIDACLEQLRIAREKQTEEFTRILNDRTLRNKFSPASSNVTIFSSGDDDDDVASTSKPLKGPGSKRGSAKGRSKGKKGPVK